MRQAVGVITLGTVDLPRARAFYEALGWKTGAAPDDDVVFFQCPGLVFALWDRKRLAEVDSVIEEARAAGAIIGREPAETFWGGYSGVFIDTDAHPWEVAHNPHWAVKADGSVKLGG